MESLVEIKNGSYLEFCTELPHHGDWLCQRLYSPQFILMDHEWCFELEAEGTNIIKFNKEPLFYYAKMIKGKRIRGTDPHPFSFPRLTSFQFDFNIGFVNEKDLSLGKGTMEVILEKGFDWFWKYPINDLKSKLPAGYRTGNPGNILKFVFHFFLPSDPILQLLHESHDKCVQTSSSYLNTDLSTESLSKDFAQLLYTGMNQDVEMKCGKLSIKAHKLVLSARSSVFKAMLHSDMREGRTGVVNIQDIHGSYFGDFVTFLYTDVLTDMTFDKAIALYEVGDKYAVKSLMLRCSEYLHDNFSQENAFQCLAFADAHSDAKLKVKVISFILENKTYLQEEVWMPFCDKYPKIAVEVYKLSHKK